MEGLEQWRTWNSEGLVTVESLKLWTVEGLELWRACNCGGLVTVEGL